MSTLPAKFEATRMDYFSVYPETLTRVTDKSHPLYDKRVEYPFEESWVLAAMDGGMPDPLFVQKEGDNLLIVEGRQRHSAVLEANRRLKKSGRELIKVPVITKKGDEAVMLGLMISSNMLRKENTIADNADLAQRFIATGKTTREAAIRFGVSDQSISNWLAYLELSGPVKKAIERGEITASAGIQMKNLTPAEQKIKLEELKLSGVKGTISAVKNVVAGKSAKSKPRPSVTQIEALLKCADIPSNMVAIVNYVLGDMTREDAEAVLPWMKEAEVEVVEIEEEEDPAVKVKVETKKKKKSVGSADQSGNAAFAPVIEDEEYDKWRKRK